MAKRCLHVGCRHCPQAVKTYLIHSGSQSPSVLQRRDSDVSSWTNEFFSNATVPVLQTGQTHGGHQRGVIQPVHSDRFISSCLPRGLRPRNCRRFGCLCRMVACDRFPALPSLTRLTGAFSNGIELTIVSVPSSRNALEEPVADHLTLNFGHAEQHSCGVLVFWPTGCDN